MMTSSNGNIFRVTGPLCGEFTGSGEFPTQRPVTRSFDVFFDLRLNKRLSKQPSGWWFETQPWSLWRQCNVTRRSWSVHVNLIISIYGCNSRNCTLSHQWNTFITNRWDFYHWCWLQYLKKIGKEAGVFWYKDICRVIGTSTAIINVLSSLY